MSANDNDNEDYVAPKGLSSRKRMHDSYRIMQANNVERESGSEEAIISVSHRYPCFLFFTFSRQCRSFHMHSCCSYCSASWAIRALSRLSCIEPKRTPFILDEDMADHYLVIQRAFFAQLGSRIREHRTADVIIETGDEGEGSSRRILLQDDCNMQ